LPHFSQEKGQSFFLRPVSATGAWLVSAVIFWKSLDSGRDRGPVLEVTAAINVCYDITDRETFLRELSGLQEAMEYFKLKESLLITAEAQPRKIAEKGLKIKIRPFHQWALEH
jgi:hypothetical protein